MSDIQCFTHSMTQNFTIISNEVINHPNLSLQAKGLLIWAISKPPEWKMNILSICKIHNISKNKVNYIVKELKDNNLLIISKGKNGYTKWLFFGTSQDYQVFIKAHPEKCAFPQKAHPEKCAFPQKAQKAHLNLVPKAHVSTPTDRVVKPYPHFEDKGKNDDPHYEDHHNEDHHSGTALVSTDLLKRTNNIISTDPVENEFDKLWQVWPNTKNKKRSLDAWRTICKNNKKQTPQFICQSLIQDTKTRIANKQFAFDKTMLSSYLNGERWNDGHEASEVRKDPLLVAMGLA